MSIPVNIIVRIALNLKYGKDNVNYTNHFFGNKWYLIDRSSLLEEKEKASNGIELKTAIDKLFQF